jgi:predicted amidophosphoribosyltransferase
MQSEETYEGKRMIIQDTMTSNPDVVRGIDVLLVDDILDSGWSVKECARSLKEAGAKSVRVLTVTKTHAFVDETLGGTR